MERVELFDRTDTDDGNLNDIWVIGDSLVHWAGTRASQRCKDLGVEGVCVGWHGTRG